MRLKQRWTDMFTFLRFTNDNCIHCGHQLPTMMDVSTNNRDVTTYRCEKCNDIIVRGVVAKHSESVRATRSDVSNIITNEQCLIGDDVAFTTWEVWWTDATSVCAINGRVTCGEQELYDFVVKLQKNHGTQ